MSDESLRQHADDCSRKKEALERQMLAEIKVAVDPIKDVSTESFAQKLEKDEGYIDIMSYQPLGAESAHYAAIVITRTGPTFVDIPNAQTISQSLTSWRGSGIYSRARALAKEHRHKDERHRSVVVASIAPGVDVVDDRAQWAVLRQQLWQPILAKIPANVAKLSICDDGELSRLPWEMLVNESAGGRQFLVARVDSPRELVLLRPPEEKELSLTKGIDSAKEERVLLVGDINYQDPGLSLSGTGKEISDIERLFARRDVGPSQSRLSTSESATRNPTVTVLRHSDPTPDKIKAVLPLATVAHLATHGFFAKSDAAINGAGSTSRSITRCRGTECGALVSARNPLVASGILLAPEPGSLSDMIEAGSGRRSIMVAKSKKGMHAALHHSPVVSTGDGDITIADEGKLTAEELMELNLSNCDLVVLSACETGRGTEERGQGVLGLRSALMAAGAKSVILSLWSVDDSATRFLMTEFYKQLLKGKSKAEALQLAESAVRNDAAHPQWKEPYYWAAWALVGQGW